MSYRIYWRLYRGGSVYGAGHTLFDYDFLDAMRVRRKLQEIHAEYVAGGDYWMVPA